MTAVPSSSSGLKIHPSSRDFEVKDLTVLTAQTGNESELIKKQVENHIYPLLREHKVRTVQIARSGYLLSEGYQVLDDTTSPECCHIEGAYTLADELLSNGTIPQYASKRRRCSNKSKGVVLYHFTLSVIHIDKKPL